MTPTGGRRRDRPELPLLMVAVLRGALAASLGVSRAMVNQTIDAP